MRRRKSSLRTLLVTLLLVAGVGYGSAASGQAWVPPRGNGGVTLAYQYLHVTRHLFSVPVPIGFPAGGPYFGNGTNSLYLGDIDAQSAFIGFDYGLLPNLGLGGQVAYVSSMYHGAFPEAALDDGHYHGTLQNADINLRYMFQWARFAITPELGYTVPMRNYSTMGHIVAGTGLREISATLNLGRGLGPWLPDAYITAMYAHAFVQHLDGYNYNLDRDEIHAEVGYFVTRAISARAFWITSQMHDGMDWAWGIQTLTDWMNHDAAAYSRYVRVGGGMNYAFGPSVTVFASLAGTTGGANTHSGLGIETGVSKNFSQFLQHAPSSTVP
jgi:hypothetical protein